MNLSGGIGLVAVVVGFLVLIAPHEAGHFAMAKLVKVRVHEFSVGFGTRILSFTRRGTLYALRLIPLGGYVRLAGMEPGEYDLPDGFHRRPAAARLAVLVAGPLANFLLASILIAAVLLPSSSPVPGYVQSVLAASPAAQAGLHAGDAVVAADGVQLNGDMNRLRSMEAAHAGAPLTLQVKSPSGALRTLTVTPKPDPSRGGEYIIGISSYSTAQAVTDSLEFPWLTIRDIGGGIWQLASGRVPGGLTGPQGVTGPIGISYYVSTSAAEGFGQWLQLMALLSVALGLTNLLPLPALDGGRIVVVLLEVLRRQPFDREREQVVQRAGMVALLVLVAFISYLDITRILNHQFPGPH